MPIAIDFLDDLWYNASILKIQGAAFAPFLFACILRAFFYRKEIEDDKNA